MGNIIKQIDKAFKLKEERRWDKLYFVFDIHETILHPSFSKDISLEFYDYAKDTLVELSKRDDITLIMWTCSPKDKIIDYLKFFEKNDIHFDYVNENPEYLPTEYASFDKKLYCNVGFDDKFGFDAECDWIELYEYFCK